MRLVLLFISVMTIAAFAEPGGGRLTGRVVDPSGAVVPGLTVEFRNTDRLELIRAVTDYQGVFRSPVLGAGRYVVNVNAPGFRPFAESVRVNEGETTTENIDLKLADLGNVLTITAKSPPLESAVETATKNFKEVLEIRQVRESSARDVGEALASVGGLWKVRKGGIASDVVLRGFQQDNVNILIDGVRIHGACPNNMDPPAFHVDFSEIQQVEVVKGAFDVKNQGSLGGSINVINKNPEGGLRITPNISAGSFGYFNPSIAGSVSKESIYALAGYSFRRSRPYVDGSGKRFTEYANFKDNARDLNAFDINTSWFKFGAAPTSNHRFELGYTRQGGGEVLYPYLLMDALYDNADRVNASYHITNPTGLVSQIRIHSYLSQVKHWMTDERRLSSVGAARPYSMATFAGTKAFGGRVEAEVADFSLGVEAHRRNWNAVNTMRMGAMYSDQPSVPDVNMMAGGVFAQFSRSLFHTLQVTAGARLDTATSEARSATLSTDLFWVYKGTRRLSKTDTVPSGNVWLAYSLPRGFQVFAGVGHTARMPDPQERYFALKRMGSDWVGNPNLRPTKNTEADLGINYKGRHFTLRPTVFLSRLTDFVTVHNQPRMNMAPGIMNPAARSYDNVGAKMYGGEMSYSVGFTRALLLFGGLSYTRGIKEAVPSSRIFDRNIAEIPPLRSRTSLRYGTKRFFGEIEGIAVQRQTRVDLDLKESPTPGYGTVNLKTGIHSSRINAAIGIDNVFDRFYSEHLSYQRDAFRLGTRIPEPGRSLYVTLSYGF